eukprot:766957-Hanusia_phi.AAC.12
MEEGRERVAGGEGDRERERESGFEEGMKGHRKEGGVLCLTTMGREMGDANGRREAGGKGRRERGRGWGKVGRPEGEEEEELVNEMQGGEKNGSARAFREYHGKEQGRDHREAAGEEGEDEEEGRGGGQRRSGGRFADKRGEKRARGKVRTGHASTRRGKGH